MSDSLTLLLNKVHGVARRRLRRFEVIALSGVLAVLIGLFLVFSATDIALKLSKGTRAALSTCSLALICMVGWKLARAGMQAVAEARRIAAQVEREFPDLETSLSTSVEFGSDEQKTQRLSSPALVEALVDHTRKKAEALDFLRTVDWRWPKVLAAVAAFTLGACIAYVVHYPRLARLTFARMVYPWRDLPAPTLTLVEVSPRDCEVRRASRVEIVASLSGRIPRHARIFYRPANAPGKTPSPWKESIMQPRSRSAHVYSFPRLMQSIQYSVKAGDCRTRPYTIEVYEIPKIVRMTATFTYPEYTGLKPKTNHDFLGPITAIKGTRVDIDAAVNTPVNAGGIQFRKHKRTGGVAELKGPQRLHASLLVMANDQYRLWVSDAKGRTNEDAIFFSIRALDDAAPQIKLEKPDRPNIKATKTTEIPIVTEAKDDFGLAEVGLAFRIKTEPEHRLTIKKLEKQLKKCQAESTLYLEDMELADTDVVAYYAYAIDNNQVTGPQEGVSALHFIEIRPYGEQYKKSEKQSKSGGGKEKEKNFIPKLDDVIKRQKEVLGKTFTIEKIEPRPFAEDALSRIADLSAQEDSLRKTTDELARQLVDALRKAGMPQHLDRVENLVRARDEMGLAAYTLTKARTDMGQDYENAGLYHLYRAKRDLIHLLQETKDPKAKAALEQALQEAAKSATRSQRENQASQSAKMQQKARELERLLREQAALNKELRNLASEVLQAQRNASKLTPTQRAERMLNAAKKQNDLAQRAKDQAQQLAEMAQEGALKERIPRSVRGAADEMRQTQEQLHRSKPDQARDHGKKAEDRLAEAVRELRRAAQQSLAEQLRAAAEDAAQLAQRQKQAAAQSQQQARRQNQSAAQAQPKSQRQAKAAQSQRPSSAAAAAQTPGSSQPHTPQSSQHAQAPTPKANQNAEKLQKQQQLIRRDLDQLRREFNRLREPVAKTDQQAGEELKKLAQAAGAPQMQKPMREAEQELKRNKFSAAAAKQRQAQAALRNIAQRARAAADQFAMGEEERLGRALTKARELQQRQAAVNRDVRKAQQTRDANAKLRKAQQSQRRVREDTEKLKGQIPRIKALADAALDKAVAKKLDHASEEMKNASAQMGRRDVNKATEHGRKAERQLGEAAKAMQQVLNESLGRKLAQAAESARKARDTQRNANQMLAQAAKGKRDRQPLKPEQEDQIAQEQESVRQRVQSLNDQLDQITRQARAAGKPRVAKSVQNTARQLQRSGTQKRLAEAQRALQRRQWAAVQRQQRAAAESLDNAYRRLRDIQEDVALSPAEKLKRADSAAQKLAKDLKTTTQKIKQAAKPTTKGKKSQPENQQRVKELAKDADSLARRVERLSPTKKERELTKKLRQEMAKASRSLARRDMEKATDGLTEASKAVQKIGDGIIQRIARLTDKAKRRSAEKEEPPQEFRRLVEHYFKRLSEK